MIRDIYETIKSEVDNFIDNPIEIVPGYTFNQYDTIKRNHLYYNSMFEDNSPYNGRDKIFDNIVTYGCIIESTLLDFDTKDSQLLALNPTSKEAEFFLQKELEIYLKKNNLDRLYDDLADELPIYGSAVIKKDKVPYLVDLRRLFCDPTVNRIWESRFIILKHYLTASQLREKKGIWDDKVIDKMLKDKSYRERIEDSYEDSDNITINTESPYYVVYERYGEVPKSWLEDKPAKGDYTDEDYVRSLFITTNPDCKNGLTLFKSEWKDKYPFKDAHRRKTRGRWLGISAIEEKFPDQVRTNELANQKAVAMEVSSLQLYQTSDSTILRNVLQDKKSGDIIKKSQSSDGLQPVDTRVKNFTEFQAEEEKWYSHADRMSFTQDTLRGGDIPSTMPATNAVIQNNNSTSVHLKRREGLANTLREMFNDWILPNFKKTLTKEHMIKFSGSGDEVKVVDEMFRPSLIRDKKVEQMLSGQIINEELAIQEVEEYLRTMGNTRWVEIMDKMYNDIEFEYDVLIDGQQKNLQTSLNNTWQVFNTLASNPQMLNDPRIKVLFYEFMKLSGISPLKIEQAEKESQSMPQQPMQGMPQIKDIMKGMANPQSQNMLNQMNNQM